VKHIVCSHSKGVYDTGEGNSRMQQIINDDSEQYSGYWFINPNFPEKMDEELEKLSRAKGFVGFKFLPDYHTYPVDGPNFEPVLKFANEKQLLVLIHTWGGSGFNNPGQIANIAKKYPDIVLIMGHSGYGDWESSVKIAKEFPNVYLDITAVYVAHDFAMFPVGAGTPIPLASELQVNGIIEYMVKNAGSEKVLFGTDMPWYSPHFAIGTVLFSRITDEDRMNILYANAEKLLIKVAHNLNCI